jgi:hypothetical protein
MDPILSPFASYVRDFWANSYAHPSPAMRKGVTQNYPGSTALGTYRAYMMDDHDTFLISAPTAQGKYGIFFEGEGCAVDPGCAP